MNLRQILQNPLPEQRHNVLKTGNPGLTLHPSAMTSRWGWFPAISLRGIVIEAIIFGTCSLSTLGVTYYVDSTYGNDTNAGMTRSTAKASIQAAVNAAATNDTVLVNAGIYSVTATLNITNAITVKSLMGAHHTVIEGGYPTRRIRCVRISNQQALFDGFTVRNGTEGVMFDGEASGTMRNCVVTGIAGNGVFFNHGGTAQSCTIANNSGIGLYASEMGGGGDPAVNLIVSGNTTNWFLKSANIVCDHCFVNDPQFAGTNDFRLLPRSPCIDTGRNMTWMTSDIAAQGNPRIDNTTTDIGAYEFIRLQTVLNPANGHYYAYVPAQLAWPQARSVALNLSHNGWPGYLATITSQAEQDFIVSNLTRRDGFLGGSDSEIEGDWKWMDGPEANQFFFRG